MKSFLTVAAYQQMDSAVADCTLMDATLSMATAWVLINWVLDDSQISHYYSRLSASSQQWKESNKNQSSCVSSSKPVSTMIVWIVYICGKTLQAQHNVFSFSFSLPASLPGQWPRVWATRGTWQLSSRWRRRWCPHSQAYETLLRSARLSRWCGPPLQSYALETQTGELREVRGCAVRSHY